MQIQALQSRFWLSGMKVNGSENPWIGPKEIRRGSLRRIGCRQVEQRTMAGAGPDGATDGGPSSSPSRPDATARGSRAWFREEMESVRSRSPEAGLGIVGRVWEERIGSPTSLPFETRSRCESVGCIDPARGAGMPRLQGHFWIGSIRCLLQNRPGPLSAGRPDPPGIGRRAPAGPAGFGRWVGEPPRLRGIVA